MCGRSHGLSRTLPQCKNADAGCSVTCPLAHRKGHQDSCPFELTACPNDGCPVKVPRGSLAEHSQVCAHAARQRCPLGCGATLNPGERTRHNCYRELRDAWSQSQERSRGLLLGLLRRMRKVHRTTSLLRRQLAQLGDFLEDDALLVAAPPVQQARATPEGSRRPEVWGAQGHGTFQIEG